MVNMRWVLTWVSLSISSVPGVQPTNRWPCTARPTTSTCGCRTSARWMPRSKSSYICQLVVKMSPVRSVDKLMSSAGLHALAGDLAYGPKVSDYLDRETMRPSPSQGHKLSPQPLGRGLWAGCAACKLHRTVGCEHFVSEGRLCSKKPWCIALYQDLPGGWGWERFRPVSVLWL